MSAHTSFLPVPEFNDNDLSHSFKQNTTDQYRPKRPPKLYSKQNHDSSFNKSLNATTASVISFNGGKSLSSEYSVHLADSYFEQCFEVIELLGEGSFSQVFKVRSKDDGCFYAVKKAKCPYKSEKHREERLEEVLRHEQLSMNDHCVTLYYAWEQDAFLYMQMELCSNNLETFVFKKASISEEMVWSILVDLLLALKALHDRNLIHLDIKLENILINDDNVCKLGDFGLVVDLNKPNLHESMEGDSRYVAPELMQFKFTKAADIFSVGITTLELACNMDLPKNGPLWVELRNDKFPPCFDSISAELQQVIRSSMNSAYEDRPNIDTLLMTPKVQAILAQRKRFLPLKRIAKDYPRLIGRFICQTLCKFRKHFVWLVSIIISAFSLKYVKQSPVTPKRPQLRLQYPSDCSADNSLLLLEDSEIENSPAKTSSPINVTTTGIVNSTPLTHHLGSYRKTRRDASVLGLDDSNGSFYSDHFSPSQSVDLLSSSVCKKRKKLFMKLDDSE